MKLSDPRHTRPRRTGSGRVGAALVLAASLAALALSGCGDGTTTTRPASVTPAAPLVSRGGADPAAFTGPGGTGPDGVPLGIGNRWVYQRRYRMSVLPPEGAPHTVFQIDGTITLTLGCLDTTDTGVYAFQNVVEVQRIQNVANTSVSWRDLRADRNGLYEIVPSKYDLPQCPELPDEAGAGRSLLADPDRLIATAMASLPPTLDASERSRALALIASLARRGAALERPHDPERSRSGERMRLAYPLSPGRRWSYEDPELQTTVASVVTGREACTVPAGTWKAAHIVQTWTDRSAPGDTIEAWYGPVGLLRYRYRLVTGEPGRTRYLTENEQRLVRVTFPDGRGRLDPH